MARPTEGQDPWFADITAYFDGLESADQTNAAAAASASAGLLSHTSDTSNPHSVTKGQLGLGSVDNTSDAAKPISDATANALGGKAPLASPAFTGTVSGITKDMVGLGNVDNTSDANKPVQPAVQTALDSKAPLDSPTFTGTVSGLSSAMVGLGQVDNTADVDKPVSNPTQGAIDHLELVTCQMLGRPTHPGNIAISARTSTTITLTWDASIAPPGGSTTNYRVYKDGAQVAASVGTTATTYTVTGLTGDTAYEFYVVPSNTTGDGLRSFKLSARTLVPAVPSPPTGLQLTSWSDTTASLTWNSVAPPVTGYKVYRGVTLVNTGATTSYQDTGLTQNTTYVYTVKAYNTDGDSAASDSVTVTTDVTVTAPAVRGTDAASPSTGSPSTITNTLPAGIVVGDVGYAVAAINNGTDVPTSVSSPSGAWTLEDGPVTVSTTQKAVLYRKALTTADASGTLTATFPNGGRLALDHLVLSGSSTVTDRKVSFTQASGATTFPLPAITPGVTGTRLVCLSVARFLQTTGNQYNFPAGWTVHQNFDGGQSTSPQIGAAVASRTLGAAGVAHAAESGSFNAAATFIGWLFTVGPTGAAVPPAPPSVVSTSATSSSVTIDWTAPTAPVGDPVLGYKVYHGAGGSPIAVVSSSGTRTYTETGLTASTAYTYKVTAYNNAGEGAASATVSVSTKAAGAARFPGDPTVGKMLMGHASGTYTCAQFDKRVFPGATASDPPVRRFKLDRSYNGNGQLLLDTTRRGDLTANSAAGRITVLSWKEGGYTHAQVASGAADADIDANATFMNSVGTPIWWAYHHEPDSGDIIPIGIPLGSITAAQKQKLDDYRRAYRRQIDRIRAIAPNVAFFSPFYTGGIWNDASGSSTDWRWYHPNWDGNIGSGGGWLSNGPFGGSWINGDGIDMYNPKVGSKLDSNSRNQSWESKAQAFLTRRAGDGGLNLPWAIGELGTYNTLATLTNGGAPSNQDQDHDMITIGAVSEGLVGCCWWNNSEAVFDDTKDLYPTVGARTTALRTEINNNLSTVVMG